MKTLTSVLFLILASTSLFANNVKNPIFVLRQNGYFTNFGAGPLLVIYSDSTVIYQKTRNHYFTVKLSGKEFSFLTDSIDFQYLFRYKQKEDSLSKLFVDTTNVAGLSLTQLIFWQDKSEQRISFYESIPDEKIDKLILFLRNYSNKRAKSWVPERIEIDLWYIYVSNADDQKSINWKAKWPDTSDVNSIRRFILVYDASSRYYSIYLPKKYWKRFYRIWKRKFNSPKFCLINLHDLKWIPVGYRFPFPCEDKWQERLADE